MSDYFELKIKINPDMSEEVSNLCFEKFDCEGVVLAEEIYEDDKMVSTTSSELKAFIKDKEINEFFCNKVLTEARNIFLSRRISNEELGSWDFTLTKIENQDWSKKWKENWGVTHISDKITVVPSWIDYSPKKDEITVKLDPGCAFGTGTHQTTQLCVMAIEKYLKEDFSVADIGMGSGILAIIAKKIGAKRVYGCDNDASVIEVAIENAKVNNVECEFEYNTVDNIDEKFDFICANILHNVLSEIMGNLKNVLKDKAKLSLSGIIEEKAPVVIDAINREGLTIIDEFRKDQWVSFVVER